MKPKDRTDAMIKNQLQILDEMENAWNRKEVSKAKRQLKKFSHKFERTTGKRFIYDQLFGTE